MERARKPLTERYLNDYSVLFSPEQHDLIWYLTNIYWRRSFTDLLEAAFAHYIPAAYEEVWPRARRYYSPRGDKKRTRTYGIALTAEQDAVMRRIMRRRHLNFADIVEAALGDYVPVECGVEWPHMERASKHKTRRAAAA